MEHTPFDQLNFDQRPRLRLTPRTLFLLGILAVYCLAWWLLPIGTLFWLGLICVLGLAWVASHGWRRALDVLHTLIHHLESR
jgi:hypothetical protein